MKVGSEPKVSRQVSGVGCEASKISFSKIWFKLKRLEKERCRRAYAPTEKHSTRPPDELLSRGLDTQFLSSFLYWLIEVDVQPDPEFSATTSEILLSAFRYQADYSKEHMDERGKDDFPSQFGSAVVQKLAFQCARTSDDHAARIYHAVLRLGPVAHHIIDQFMGSWFIQLHKTIDTEAFCSRWKSMIQFGLDGQWAKGGRWYDEQKLLRKILGFEHSTSLINIQDVGAKLASMSNLYESWASANLGKDEQNVSSFAYFLKSEPCDALRIDGLKWLAECLTGVEKNQYWGNSGDTGASLVDLIDKALRVQKAAFQTDSEARQALLKLTALLVAKQIPSALALQQKISTLR